MDRKSSERTAARVFLLGSNVQKSISPAIQNRAFEKSGFHARYGLFQVPEDEFDSAMAEVGRASDILGFNVTAPYKERILPYLARVDRHVRGVGAVNTIKIGRRGNWAGYNTDINGIVASLKKLGSSGKKCVILGAGGAAKACMYAALKNGFDEITILNRTKDRAKHALSHFESQFPRVSFEALSLTKEDFASAIRNCDLLINAVASTYPFPIKTDFSDAPKRMKFFDLGYKEVSDVLKEARKNNIRSIDGVLMVVEQGAKSFEIWTGLEAPRKEMIIAGRRALARKPAPKQQKAGF
ncbi:MAG: shikimate dehydrogenase family protein [Nitrososphaerales archaeon]